MAVNLSPVFGVAGQLFDNNGNPLAGGKIFTYLAGTTTNATTYTSSNGTIAHSNPIILDGAGRVPSGEIWLTDGVLYKFVVQDSANNLIGTYDNLSGINSNFVAYSAQQEIQTATAGQTVFNLATMQYQPGTNSLSVFVDGVNQYGPGAQYAYVETDQDTVTFVSGLHVGASVKFTTTQLQNAGLADASQVTYQPPFVGSVATNVEAKLAQYVSVFDFMTSAQIADVQSNSGLIDVTAAIQAAIDESQAIYLPSGTYLVSTTLLFKTTQQSISGAGFSTQIKFTGSGTCIDFDGWSACSVQNVFIYSTGGTVAIDIGPNAAVNRFAHWWRLKNIIVLGNVPNWSTSYLANVRAGFSQAAFQVETAFYGVAEGCEAAETVGSGFYLFNQANGNTFLGCDTRNCAVGVKISGNQSSNGNNWFGGNIEATSNGSIGIQIDEAERNVFSCRMEISATGGTHVIVNPPATKYAQENNFIGMSLTGTSAGYVIGGANASGSNYVRGTFISGGKLGASVVINSDCLGTRVEPAITGASGVTITDNGFGSIIHADVGGGRWYERPSNQNTTAYNHDLLVGTGSVRESMGDNAKTLSFTSQTDFFQFYKLTASGTDLPIMRFGAYRIWVNPLDGKMYINSVNPTTPTDGTVVGTQT